MTRTPGARNRGYDEKRHQLALALAPHLTGGTGGLASFSDMATAAGVSPTTLKHYFGDRDGAYAGAVTAVASEAAVYLGAQVEQALTVPTSEGALRDFLDGTVEAWRRHGLGVIFTGTLAWGLTGSARGPVFLDGVLEPLVEATRELIGGLAERRGTALDQNELRLRAVALLSPLVVALLHQDPLGGAGHHPLDLDGLIHQLSTTTLL